MKYILGLIFSFGFAAMAMAADPEDILVIEVGGSVEGRVEIELLPDLAPAHVQRIKRLAREGYYNGIAFHRVLNNFMAQTGDVKFGKIENFLPRYAGQGESIYPDLQAEFSTEPFVRGTVGMARSEDINSANSQFFIMYARADYLDDKYTVFGRVLEGMEVVDGIRKGTRATNGAMADPDHMDRVFIKADEE
ncbi:MAG: peptidylprolyl isomerase [Pseudomonadota bacterium]